MANSFNLEDDPISLVFFFTNIITLLYIAHRACVLAILGRASSRLKGSARGTSLWKKLLVICWPGLFALLLLVRTTTHALNNACFELVPLAYLMRFTIHNMLLAFQLRAVFIIRFNSLWLSRPQNLRLFSKWVFPVLLIPAGVLIILFWAFRTGAALSGVCTLTDPWAWIAQSYEYLFVAFNIACEILLRRSGIILDQKKRELQIATRIALALLCYDTLFRFGLVQYIIEVSCGRDKTSSTYKGLSKAYSILFSIIFVGGISSYFAYTYELFWARHCGLTHPFQRRYWRLLLGEEELTQSEQDFYKTRKAVNHGVRPAKHTAPQGEPMIRAGADMDSPLGNGHDNGNGNGNGNGSGGLSSKRPLSSASNVSGGSNDSSQYVVEVKNGGGYDLDEEDGNDTTRGSSVASSRKPLHDAVTQGSDRSDKSNATARSKMDRDDDDDDAELSRHEAQLEPMDAPPIVRAGSRAAMPPIAMTRSGSRGGAAGTSINYGDPSSVSRSSLSSMPPAVISSSSPTLSPSLERSSSASNTTSASRSSISPPLTSSSPILASVVVIPSVASPSSSSAVRATTPPTPPAGSMMDYGSVHSVKLAASSSATDITRPASSSFT